MPKQTRTIEGWSAGEIGLTIATIALAILATYAIWQWMSLRTAVAQVDNKTKTVTGAQVSASVTKLQTAAAALAA